MDRKLIIGMLKDWGLALVVVVAALVVWNLVAGPAAAPPSGAPAPDFTLRDLNGQAHTLSEQRGKIVVVNFWATWCGPCRAEIPAFSAFAESHPDVVVWGVSLDRGMSAAQLEGHAKRLGVKYTVLHDARDQVGAPLFGVRSLPTTVIIREDGSIRHVRVGAMSGAELDGLVHDHGR
jgi:peroxiredoxin